MNIETIKRFWSKVNKDGPIPSHRKELGNCWIWMASKRCKGYGAFVWADDEGKIIQGRAHRFSWELEHGSLDAKICVLHHCDTPACIRPSHLFIGTKAINNEDMVAKGRHVPGGTHCGQNGKYERGEDHHNAKFTWNDIEGIRSDRSKGMSFSQLAKKYKSCIAHVWNIVKGKAWKTA